jgi:putative ABC transport system permease protein
VSERTWRRIERRLSRVLPSAKVASAIGDLAEDYSNRRAATGRIRARFWLASEIRSIERVYRAHGEPSMSVDSRPRRHLTSTVIADVRYTMRRWRRRPGFAITAAGILALGIAATTSIFSVIDAVLLQPLPWREPDRLVAIYSVEPERLQRPSQAAAWNRAPLALREWQALQQSGAFEMVTAWMPNRFLYTGDSGPELLDGIYAGSNLLHTLGVTPQLGRMFTADEDRTDSSSVLLSHEIWQRAFGGDEQVIGRSIAVGLGASSRGEPRTVVGVLPPRLRFQGQAPEIMLPLGIMAYNLSYDTNRPLRLLARLGGAVPIERASAALGPVIRPTESSARRSGRAVPLIEDEIGQTAGPLWLLFGGAALLLLVACTNVAGLLLGEARARRHEIAVRLSLGGRVARILRQLTIEQLLLDGVAAIAGVVLATWITPLLVAVAPAHLPRLDTVAINPRIAVLGIALGVITSMAFSILPAIQLARTPAVAVLAEGGRDGAARRTLGQRLVVAAEIGIALMLVVAASLFGETIARLTSRPLGFTSDHLIVVSLAAAARPYTADEWQRIVSRRNDPETPSGVPIRGTVTDMRRRIREYDLARTTSILNRLSAVPGTVAVAGVTTAPFVATPVEWRARDAADPASPAVAASRFSVTDQYFRAIGLPIVRGRGFNDTDGLEDRRVVISRELERRAFNGDAVGRQISVTSSSAATATASVYDIVGVAENAKQREYADDDRAAIYVHDRSGASIGNAMVGQFVIRASGDAAALIPHVRQSLRAATDPPLAVTSIRTMDDLVAGSVAEPRFRATLATIFGASALVLAAVGLYGLATRRVEERRREISVRIALGAQKRDVRGLVLRDALWTVGLGLAIGLPAAFAASQITQTLLYGVSATSPHIFVLSSGILVAAALAATIVPARRAAAADPIIALKE